jgi:hypothetical protein
LNPKPRIYHEKPKAMGTTLFFITGVALAGSDDCFAANRFAGHVVSFRNR